MSGAKIFVDTNIILYVLNGDKTLADFLNDKQIYISFITELELLGFHGLRETDLEVIRDFIQQCKVININDSIKEETIRLRSVYKTKLPDSIIMASSIYMDLPIITADAGFKKAEAELNLVYYQV